MEVEGNHPVVYLDISLILPCFPPAPWKGCWVAVPQSGGHLPRTLGRQGFSFSVDSIFTVAIFLVAK